MSPRLAILPAVALSAVAFVVAGCGGGNNASTSGSTSSTSANTDVKGKVSIIGVWTGDEQKSFQAVLDGFKTKYPNVNVKYTSAGDNVPTVLGTAVEGGHPPDLASIAQPGVVAQFEKKGALKPLDFARSDIQANYPADFLKLGTINGKLYSFVFKAANKSTVWYNVGAYQDAGIKPAQDWSGFLSNAKTLQASGVNAYAFGAADGWTLTDLFENVFLRQAGADRYDQLSNHDMKWTDPAVKRALSTMAETFTNSGNIAGGRSGALQTDFPTSVSQVFRTDPKAARVMEGDFVPGVVASKTDLKPSTGYDVAPFPKVGNTNTNVVGGGDSIAMFRDTPAARALVKYLASPDAAEIWVRRGGFSSPNKNVPASAYPDGITRTTATAIAKADTFRFDMSDLAPASFGGTAGQGEWKILQDFFAHPSDVNGTAQKLEASAAKAFSS